MTNKNDKKKLTWMFYHNIIIVKLKWIKPINKLAVFSFISDLIYHKYK